MHACACRVDHKKAACLSVHNYLPNYITPEESAVVSALTLFRREVIVQIMEGRWLLPTYKHVRVDRAE